MASQETGPADAGAASPIDSARALAPRIAALSDRIERDRRLPPDLVRAMAEAGLFRICVPRKFDGLEVDVSTMIGTIEEVARADASAGWCVMIGATSGVVSAWLRDDVARPMYGGDPLLVTGGVFAPHGRAVAVPGGYRVSGRWPFASGSQHCGWLMGGCVVTDDGTPRLLSGGAVDPRMMLFPASEARIIDTWTVSGLCGTGSHDMEVSDIFVPGERSVSLISDRPLQPGPLYAFPVFGLLALGIAGVALGIARSAIDALVRLASAKTPTGSRKRLADRPATQAQVARAEALARSARAFLLGAVEETWREALGSGSIGPARRALCRLAATNAAVACAQAVDLMYEAGGGTSIYATSPLQRHFRDIHVLTQHMMVAPPVYELAGRLLLGLDTDVSTL
jgi:alkylation response protein AidB-like acyl-CoA dehydrogenase